MLLYEKPANVQTRWVSFENQTGARAQAALENGGAKGNPFQQLQPGETRTLLDLAGSGLITRMWVTIVDRGPVMLRGLRLDMYWDDATEPAVSCPFGDFFGISLGRTSAFESQLFSSPEGRSFNCFVPMPFRRNARITVTNETDTQLRHFFYDINALVNVDHGPDMCYFHTHWRRENPNELGRDVEILPRVRGSGRFLGCNYGINANSIYRSLWWGEGEVKVYFGDDTQPTLCGTGAEDYPGTGWGLGTFAHQTQGCPVADGENAQWSAYRQHTHDPVFFDDGCRVTIQAMGGGPKDAVLKLMDQGAPLIPVSIAPGEGTVGTIKFIEPPLDPRDPSVPDGFVNFWRQDDWSTTAWFYLDRPVSGLPRLASVTERTRDLKPMIGGNERLDQ